MSQTLSGIGTTKMMKKPRCGIIMIEKAIEYRQTLTRVQLIAVLMSLYKEEKYALKKSVGSIGGAVSQEFLHYNQKNDSYTRLK